MNCRKAYYNDTFYSNKSSDNALFVDFMSSYDTHDYDTSCVQMFKHAIDHYR